jgi:hypothetical protein
VRPRTRVRFPPPPLAPSREATRSSGGLVNARPDPPPFAGDDDSLSGASRKWLPRRKARTGSARQGNERLNHLAVAIDDDESIRTRYEYRPSSRRPVGAFHTSTPRKRTAGSSAHDPHRTELPKGDRVGRAGRRRDDELPVGCPALKPSGTRNSPDAAVGSVDKAGRKLLGAKRQTR